MYIYQKLKLKNKENIFVLIIKDSRVHLTSHYENIQIKLFFQMLNNRIVQSKVKLVYTFIIL